MCTPLSGGEIDCSTTVYLVTLTETHQEPNACNNYVAESLNANLLKIDIRLQT